MFICDINQIPETKQTKIYTENQLMIENYTNMDKIKIYKMDYKNCFQIQIEAKFYY